MNAVLAERESKGKRYMPSDEQAAKQIGEMCSDIRHLQSDVTDIKAEAREFRRTVDERFDKVDERFRQVDEQFTKINEQLAGLRDSLWSAKLWAIGLYVALSGTMLLVMAHGFKWL